MALSRTPIGTFSGSDPDGITVATIAGKNIGAGETLVVIASCTSSDVVAPAAPATVTWNGHALTMKANVNGVSAGVSIWLLVNTPNETGDIVATWSDPLHQLHLIADLVAGGDTVAPYGTKAENTNTGVTHTTGATPATAVADSILIGAIAEANSAVSGTIQAPFAAGQSVANVDADFWLSTREGWCVVAATGAYTLQATGGTNDEYAAAVIVLSAPAALPTAGGLAAPGGISQARALKIGI